MGVSGQTLVGVVLTEVSVLALVSTQLSFSFTLQTKAGKLIKELSY